MILQFALLSALKNLFTTFMAEFPNTTGLKKTRITFSRIHRGPFRAQGGQRAPESLQIPLLPTYLRTAVRFLTSLLAAGSHRLFYAWVTLFSRIFFFRIHWNCSYLFKSWQLLNFLGVLWGTLPLPTCWCRTKGVLSWGSYLNHDEWGKQLTKIMQLKATMLNRCRGMRIHP